MPIVATNTKEHAARSADAPKASAMIGPTVGPIVGGFLTTYFSWRAIFYLNVPIGIAGFVLTLYLIDNYRAPAPTRFDLRGFVLAGEKQGNQRKYEKKSHSDRQLHFTWGRQLILFDRRSSAVIGGQPCLCRSGGFRIAGQRF